MLWTETKTETEILTRYAEMRSSKKGTLPASSRAQARDAHIFESWSDALQAIRDNPSDRLTIAVRHLPKPAAFREACRALRLRIKELREQNMAFEEEVFALHRLAAIASLAPHEQLEMTPFAHIAELPLEPETIGWKALSLLGETDFAMMESCWGNPKQHVSANSLYPAIASTAQARLADILAAERSSNLGSMRQSLGAATPRPATNNIVNRITMWFQARRDTRLRTSP